MSPKNENKSDIKLPKHIAIIPDGMRRWAKERGVPTIEGHIKGAEASVNVVRAAKDLNIHTITAWGLSTENWNRSKEEVKHLMRIFDKTIKDNFDEMQKEGVRFVHLGRKDRIPQFIVDTINNTENATKENKKHVFNFAIDYGGHDELLRAFEKAHKDIQNGKITREKLWEVTSKYSGKFPIYYFSEYLDTGDQPHPYVDLIIRTSGEKRISGYLSWQAAYCEYYFESCHMPDFTIDRLKKAIEDYSNRERRYGGDSNKY